MSEEYNKNQIIRKDARNCFVESLNDTFEIGKIHFNFATYDLSKPKGKRQTNNISIYIAVDEFLELCRKLECGELKYIINSKKDKGDNSPIYQTLGGTSAERLKELNRSRADGKSLSRTMQINVGNKSNLLMIADSGPGETDDKGLIVPKYGTHPENHVVVSLMFESLSSLLLITKAHYSAWLLSWYARQSEPKNKHSEANKTDNDFF